MNNMELETDIEALDMEMGDITIHYCPVIPNPEGEPTAELKTADIEGTIYKIVDEEARTELENKVDKEEGKGLSENDYTDEDKAIVDGVTEALNGKVDKDGDKVLSDNNYSDEDKEIVDGVTEALNGKADKSDTYTKTETDNFLMAKANTSDLSTVATSGSYNDLSDTPNLSTVATSGDYNDLENKPDLSTVATSGSYDDLTDKPTIDTAISPTSTNAVQNKAIYNMLNDLLPEATATGNPIAITNASGFNAKALTVDMLPIQAGSGTPSPDNVRPISGRTSLDVTVNGETETLNFGQTVYGGTCDVVNGETSDEWEIITLNGNENWGYYRSDGSTPINSFTCKPFGNITPLQAWSGDNVSNAISNYLTVSGGGVYNHNAVAFAIDNNTNLMVSLPTDTVANFKTYLSNNPLTICYKKANPTTLTTPTTPISLNKGNNTLSTSGDNMDLKYSTTISNSSNALSGTLSMASPLNLSKSVVEEPTKEIVEPIEEVVEEPTEE